MADEQSNRIGDYEILGVLGTGGMGKVFKVRNMISDRIEAMKVLLPDLAGRQELVDRFLREIKLLASLDHPNIAQLRTALTLSNRLVMVMEFVEGTTLSDRLAQGPIPPEEAMGYVNQVLKALAYAHSRNVIHRDIKPSNMMLTPGGLVKLMDFGIARTAGDGGMTTTGTTLGSLYYMSPEQVKGGAIDARSDLYSLGVTLYEMVTGERPFKAESDYSLMTAQLQERPKPPGQVRPDLPPQLNGIILHAMAKDPAERFQSADEFRESLEKLAPALAGASYAPVVLPSAAGNVAMGATGVLAGAGAPAQEPMRIPTAQMSTPPTAPTVLELSPKPSKGRGLYMALGSAIVLVVLVVAGLSFPRWFKTLAGGQSKGSGQSTSDQNKSQTGNTDQGSGTQSSDTSTTGSQDANKNSGSATTSTDTSSNPSNGSATSANSGSGTSAGSTGTSTGSTGSSSGSAETGSAGAGEKSSTDNASGNSTSSTPSSGGSTSGTMTAKNRAPSKSGGKKQAQSSSSDATTGASTSSPGAEAGTNQPSTSGSAPAKAALEEVEQDVDQATSRANADSETLDNLRRQLSGQGLGLRADIASAQEMMKTNLAKAQQALQSQDPEKARKYLKMAEANMEKIDKFLGH